MLIEDLFEVSKATTDNLVMNYAEVDLVNLIKEVRLENEDKITSSSLDFRWNLPEEKCILRLDPQRTFRVIDNLVQNILKYSMPNSRVYIALQDQTTQVTVSFKNMSAVEMNFTPEEITERLQEAICPAIQKEADLVLRLPRVLRNCRAVSLKWRPMQICSK